MSFRRRVLIFFAALVLLPLIAVAIAVFGLISSSANGHADAKLAEAQVVASGLLQDAVSRAGPSATTIGTDPALLAALRSHAEAAIARRAVELLHSTGAVRVRLAMPFGAVVDVGAPSGIAPASRELVDASGTRLARLDVSVDGAADYADEVRRVTGMDAVVRRAGATLAATIPVGGSSLPRLGDVTVGGRRYRAASFSAADFGAPAAVSVLYDTRAAGSSTTTKRLIAAALMLAFLALAAFFALELWRALRAQVSRFAEVARRLGRGDFSGRLPTDGPREFADLGRELNRMIAGLEGRMRGRDAERTRLEDAIRRIGRSFGANLDRDALLEIVLRTAVDGVDAACGRALVREELQLPLTERGRVGDLTQYERALSSAETSARRTLRPAEVEDDAISALAFPLTSTDAADGILGLISIARPGDPFSAPERELFYYLAGQAAISIENVNLHEQVQRQAITDELTGLFNHRHFQDAIGLEIERARRFGQPLALVMLDLDNFKQINDSWGHQQGDVVLREAAAVVRACCREIDEPARYGGEELAVILLQTDLRGGHRIAERIRRALERAEIPRLRGKGALRVTASVGVAAFPESASDAESLIAAADSALYAAKRAGKNRTMRAAAQPANPVRSE